MQWDGALGIPGRDMMDRVGWCRLTLKYRQRAFLSLSVSLGAANAFKQYAARSSPVRQPHCRHFGQVESKPGAFLTAFHLGEVARVSSRTDDKETGIGGTIHFEAPRTWSSLNSVGKVMACTLLT